MKKRRSFLTPNLLILCLWGHQVETNYLEDNQIHTLEAKLHSKTERLELLENEEAEVAMNLANASTLEQQVTFQVEKSEKILSKFNVLVPQIQTCLGHGLYIQDLIFQYEDLKHLKEI